MSKSGSQTCNKIHKSASHLLLPSFLFWENERRSGLKPAKELQVTKLKLHTSMEPEERHPLVSRETLVQPSNT